MSKYNLQYGKHKVVNEEIMRKWESSKQCRKNILHIVYGVKLVEKNVERNEMKSDVAHVLVCIC